MDGQTESTLTVAAGAAIQGYSEDRAVVYWNEASAGLYGYAAEEALGRKIEDLIIPAAARDIVIAEIQRWVDGGPPPTAGLLDLVDKSGHTVRVFSNHLSVRDPSGNRTLYCLDIPVGSERGRNGTDRTDGAMPAGSVAAAGSVSALGPAGRPPFQTQLLSSLSHEIRTPLNAILGFSQMLALNGTGTRQSDRFSDYVAAIQHAGTELIRVVEQSLALFGAAAFPIEPRRVPISLNDSLVSVASLVMAGDPGEETLITFDLQSDDRIDTDPFLLNNAIAALVNVLIDERSTEDPVRIETRIVSGLVKRAMIVAEARGPALPETLRLQLLQGLDVWTDPFLSENQTRHFQLSILQRCCAALGAVLNVERVDHDRNRMVIQLPL